MPPGIHPQSTRVRGVGTGRDRAPLPMEESKQGREKKEKIESECGGCVLVFVLLARLRVSFLLRTISLFLRGIFRPVGDRHILGGRSVWRRG